MKAIGIRVIPDGVRYAIVEYNGNGFTLINESGESRLIYPSAPSTLSEKVNWLCRELERVKREFNDIEKVCVKTNEYTQRDTKGKRQSAYVEGAILLFCGQKNIPIDFKTYTSLGANNKNVKSQAQDRVGRTQQYWDTKIADAVLVAWNEVKP